ncbi:hypothetical protein J2X68_002087 [Streptomyces sp. 3330]|uniref:hypothetical protein n=1 Tax=Streptomyces sp. 3330 TaxID=2817755 RepID=UPI002866896A|nr:hypothetical protein [Streptomyces sp. 3330]
MLIKQLPRDSALNRELHGEAAEWSVTDHLLAAAVDHLAAANWMFACVNSEEGDQPDAPAPVPRPAHQAENGAHDDGDTYPEDERDHGYEDSGERSGDNGRSAPESVRSPDGSRGPGPDEAPSAFQLARFFG